ncbi:hypothetical protein PTRG_07911 [Pyrenophora tritici-repentis Pt-1C-BFP]|uniref:Uncharacterized protein n=1 Tax=Pyrenophora tritici-repentis (strain Pt-1C-BFP) TaxID=426418 RepID=B2WD52_PYRTR|nr:uncharacterized protein PTRG_07911 [Pyrenophora tritici-repentis Pt-1C-BFP]EDU50830.1 hypothetical protein PTRG_07911 [Pyrenophora tritici-repentis Pt-1C-BFP]
MRFPCILTPSGLCKHSTFSIFREYSSDVSWAGERVSTRRFSLVRGRRSSRELRLGCDGELRYFIPSYAGLHAPRNVSQKAPALRQQHATTWDVKIIP